MNPQLSRSIMESLLWQILNNSYTVTVYTEIQWNKLKYELITKCLVCGNVSTTRYYANKWYGYYSTYPICKPCLEYVIKRNVIGKADGTNIIIRPDTYNGGKCNCGNISKWAVRHPHYCKSYITYICDECADKKYHRL
jgi:hypothetical protein